MNKLIKGVITMKKIGVLICFLAVGSIAAINRSFVILTASYNNEQWYQKQLDSVRTQTYDNWRMIYINDCSSDATGQLVQDYIKHHQLEHKITFINNEQRMGHLHNQYHAIHSCKPWEIILVVDGDDWIKDDLVFSYLNEVYQDPDVWLTYGQFWYVKKDRIGICKPLPTDILTNGLIRTYPRWVTSHMRTFYAGLYQQIAFEDLQYKGTWFPMGADVSTMFPMIEMARERIRFISKIIYEYNDGNVLNFYHDRRAEQEEIEKEIRSRKPYERLEGASFSSYELEAQ